MPALSVSHTQTGGRVSEVGGDEDTPILSFYSPHSLPRSTPPFISPLHFSSINFPDGSTKRPDTLRPGVTATSHSVLHITQGPAASSAHEASGYLDNHLSVISSLLPPHCYTLLSFPYHLFSALTSSSCRHTHPPLQKPRLLARCWLANQSWRK